MVKNRMILLLLFISCDVVFAQNTIHRYFVAFKDKNNTTFSVSQPEQFLSFKSLARRNKQNIPVIAQDFPVNPGYVNSVKSTGAKVLFSTRWMNGVVVEATEAQRGSIQNLISVQSITRVATGSNGYTGGGRVKTSQKFSFNQSSQVSNNQLSMLSLDEMHADGITGNGITIAVFDTGFPGVNTNPAFASILSAGRIKDSYNFSNVSSNAFVGHPHGAQVFSIIAASTASFEGGAIDANFLLYATEFSSTEYRIEEYNWLAAAERADSAGADIITSSLGYTDFDDPSMDYKYADLNGNTAIITQAANIAFQKGIVVINSAGNYGSQPWRYISPPADGKDIIAVGAVSTDFSHASFSSYGPTADGRIKPDVMALGNPAATVLPNGSIQFTNGTSLSCPLIASLVAGVMQAWPELTSAQIVKLLQQTGSNAFHPDNTLGYGVPTYRSIKNFLDKPNGVIDFSVYPNPATSEIKIIQASLDGSANRVIISSLMGQRMMDVQYESIWQLNPYVLDISTLSSGTYIVTVENNSLRKSFRIIKL